MKTLLTRISKSDGRLSEIVRFGLTGGVAVAVQYGLYLFCIEIINAAPSVSTIVSYIVSFGLNYYLSNIFTFHSKPTKKNMALFAGCHVLNMTLQTLLTALFCKFIYSSFALLPAMFICVPTNYVMVRRALKQN